MRLKIMRFLLIKQRFVTVSYRNVRLKAGVYTLIFLFSLGITALAHQIDKPVPTFTADPLVTHHTTELLRGRITVGADQRVWHSNVMDVYAFDGRHWLHYPQLMNQTELHVLLSQDEKTLWLGSRQNGLFRYNLQTDTIQHLYTEGFEQGDLPRYTVSSMCFTPGKNKLITAGPGAVLAIDMLTGKQQRLLSESATYAASFVVCYEHVALVTLADSSMYLIDTQTNEVKSIGDLIMAPYIDKQIVDLMVQRNGVLPILLNEHQLLVAAGNQLLLVNLLDRSILPFGPRLLESISSVVREKNGRIWVSTLGAGIYAFSEKGQLLHHLTAEKSSLPGNSVTSLALSEDEWLFGLHDNQLIQVSLQTSAFKYLKNENRLTNWYAASFLQSGKLWLVEAFENLLQMDNDSQKITDMTPVIRQLLAKEGENRSLYISALHHHTAEELWFSNREHLVRYLPHSNTLTLFDEKSAGNTGPKRRVRHIFTDHQQQLWFTDLGSLLLFDNETQRFQRWPLADTSLPDSERRFVKIAQDPQNRLWAVGEFGLYLVTDGQLKQVYAYQGEGLLLDVTLDDNGNIWLLSSKSLIKVDVTSEYAITVLSPPDDYNALMQNLVNRQDSLWIGTRNGLIKFNFRQQQWQQFSWGDGIFPLASYQRGAYRLTDALVFMTQAGMLVVDPENIVMPEPKEIIRQLQVRTGTNDWRQLDKGQPLVMPASEHWLEFLLHVTEHRYPEQLRFRYKLVGYDPDWNRSSATSQFAYTGIPSGHYSFLVEVYYRHNNQLAARVEIPVRVLPPWYLTVWAYIVYTTLLLLSLWLFYRYRRQRLQQIISYESEIATSMQRAVQAQQREEELALLGRLGKELTTHLKLDDVWLDFVDATGQWVSFERGLMLCLQPPDKQSTHPDILFMPELPPALTFMTEQKAGIAQLAVSEEFKTLPTQLQLILKSKSVLYITISRPQQVYGIVFFASENAHYFNRDSLSPLSMLVEFLAVALENTNTHQHSQNLERQLLEQQKMQSLGRLVAGLAHEMNTPAGTAITASSLVQDQLGLAKQHLVSGTLTKNTLEKTFSTVQEGNDLVQRNLNRLSGLIEKFKLLSSVNEQPDINRVAVWSLFATLADIRKQNTPGIELTVVLPTQELYLDISKTGLQLIFQQVIDNVYEHAAQQQPKLRLTVVLKRINSLLVMSFCDNGCGLQSVNANQCLEPFYTTARHRGRIGLGLAIAHNITTELLSGTLTIENNPDGGCCLTICLPCSAEGH